MIQARKEIAMLNNDILNYLENLLGAFNRQIEIADRYIRDYKNDIRQLPKSAQGVMNIQRELDVNNKMYLFLLEKKTNVTWRVHSLKSRSQPCLVVRNPRDCLRPTRRPPTVPLKFDLHTVLDLADEHRHVPS